MTLTKVILVRGKVKSLFGESSRETGRSRVAKGKKDDRKSVLECLPVKRSI